MAELQAHQWTMFWGPARAMHDPVGKDSAAKSWTSLSSERMVAGPL